MVGLSNEIYEEDIMIFDNQNKIEQEQKEKNDAFFKYINTSHNIGYNLPAGRQVLCGGIFP